MIFYAFENKLRHGWKNRGDVSACLEAAFLSVGECVQVSIFCFNKSPWVLLSFFSIKIVCIKWKKVYISSSVRGIKTDLESLQKRILSGNCPSWTYSLCLYELFVFLGKISYHLSLPNGVEWIRDGQIES